MATAGVLGMTLALGVVPWVSFVLAGSFGMYGLIKKLDGAAPALQGLLGEAALVAVPSFLYLAVLASNGEATFGRSVPVALWFVAAGLMTVAPLWMFGAGVQRIPLSTMGLLQYIAPSLHLVVGVAIYGEAVVPAQAFGFVVVWIALAIFVRDQLLSSRRLASAAA